MYIEFSRVGVYTPLSYLILPYLILVLRRYYHGITTEIPWYYHGITHIEIERRIFI